MRKNAKNHIILDSHSYDMLCHADTRTNYGRAPREVTEAYLSRSNTCQKCVKAFRKTQIAQGVAQ